MRLAAIDVGTNTTRLLVAQTAPGGYRELDRRLIFTRLGEGLDATGGIGQQALNRTLQAVAEFCAVAGEFGVERIRLAATSPVREARNREDFLAAAHRLAGVEPEVLEGGKEAFLSFKGATYELGAGRYLVCDIGGGSTELLLGASGKPEEEAEGFASLDIGSVRLTERFLGSDPPDQEEITAMEAGIDDALLATDAKLPGAASARLVGVAGTVTSLAALGLGLKKYDPAQTHLLSLGLDDVRRLYSVLAGMRLEDRKQLPSLPEGRADVIVAGAAILSRVMEKWAFQELTVSEKDILDGLVMEMLQEGSASPQIPRPASHGPAGDRR
jgi:exopolyphosphatase/guanosine-5'-triphosphate,3'-diphosphate pyrophosphatase